MNAPPHAKLPRLLIFVISAAVSLALLGLIVFTYYLPVKGTFLNQKSAVAPPITTAIITAEAPQARSSVAAKSPPVLGATLGTIGLHMKSAVILQRLGAPLQQTITHGLGTPRWEYASGLEVDITDPSDPINADSVWKIRVFAPFTGATAEGFRLGATEDQFRSLYRPLHIDFFYDPLVVSNLLPQQLQVSNENDLTLTAQFNSSGIAQWLVLEETRCLDCFPLRPAKIP